MQPIREEPREYYQTIDSIIFIQALSDDHQKNPWEQAFMYLLEHTPLSTFLLKDGGVYIDKNQLTDEDVLALKQQVHVGQVVPTDYDSLQEVYTKTKNYSFFT